MAAKKNLQHLAFSVSQMKAFAEKHGVKYIEPEQAIEKRDELTKKATLKGIDEFNQRQRTTIYSHSLWSGSENRNFAFADWLPSKQRNVELAKKVPRQAMNLTKELMADRFNVIFYGDPGSGKTSLTVAMLNRLMRIGQQSAIYISTTELQQLMFRSWDDNSLVGKLNRIERAAKEADVIVLDDFGTEASMQSGKTREASNKFQDLLYRVANGDPDNPGHKRTIIISTNLDEAGLKKLYNDKLISRLIPKDNSHKIVFKGLNDLREV